MTVETVMQDGRERAEVGISQPFLAQIEAGRRAGTVSVLSRIARALGVWIDDLVDD